MPRFGAADQKIDDVVAQFVVTGQVVQLGAGALARQRVDHHFGQATGHIAAARFVAVAHEQDAVGQQNRFVHVVEIIGTNTHKAAKFSPRWTSNRSLRRID